MKDNLIGDLTYRMTQRLTFRGSVEADRFYSQARTYLGSGVNTLPFPTATLR